jgi:hypothetical protein
VKVIVILLALFVSLQLVIRLWPLPDVPWRGGDVEAGTGEWTVLGGYYRQSDVVAFDQLKARLTATPGLSILRETPTLVVVYRSWFWGFSDMIEVWSDAGVVHIRGHSVLGMSDLGSNKKRIKSWLMP